MWDKAKGQSEMEAAQGRSPPAKEQGMLQQPDGLFYYLTEFCVHTPSP